jgi:hypothetical protein
MADATWKKCERMVARILGARRTPAGRPGEPDVRGRRLSVEVKHRKQLPRWLVAALEQAERAAGDGEVAVCVLHERGCIIATRWRSSDCGHSRSCSAE